MLQSKGLSRVFPTLQFKRINSLSVQFSSVQALSHVQLFVTPWTVAYQAPHSVGFSRQEYWNGLPFPHPEDLPDPGIEPRSPTLQADALTSEPPGKPPNVRPDTIKLVEENTGKTLFDINHSNIVLDLSLRVMEIETKTDRA